jgi:hypothetical protein
LASLLAVNSTYLSANFVFKSMKICANFKLNNGLVQEAPADCWTERKAARQRGRRIQAQDAVGRRQ